MMRQLYRCVASWAMRTAYFVRAIRKTAVPFASRCITSHNDSFHCRYRRQWFLVAVHIAFGTRQFAVVFRIAFKTSPHIVPLFGARSGTRTHTAKSQRILSPLCLPIPPFGLVQYWKFIFLSPLHYVNVTWGITPRNFDLRVCIWKLWARKRNTIHNSGILFYDKKRWIFYGKPIPPLNRIQCNSVSCLWHGVGFCVLPRSWIPPCSGSCLTSMLHFFLF